MDYEYKNLPDSTGNIVYVRPVAVVDLPEEVREQAEGAEHLYAVHNEDGERHGSHRSLT